MSKERFDKTVAILVKAYLNDTLEHGNPCACAVGNMISDGMNIPLACKIGNRKVTWGDESISPDWFHHSLKETAYLQVESTTYSRREINLIEHAFENAEHGDSDGYLGLMAVLDVLAKIHGISLYETETARKLFVKA